MTHPQHNSSSTFNKNWFSEMMNQAKHSGTAAVMLFLSFTRTSQDKDQPIIILYNCPCFALGHRLPSLKGWSCYPFHTLKQLCCAPSRKLPRSSKPTGDPASKPGPGDNKKAPTNNVSGRRRRGKATATIVTILDTTAESVATNFKTRRTIFGKMPVLITHGRATIEVANEAEVVATLAVAEDVVEVVEATKTSLLEVVEATNQAVEEAEVATTTLSLRAQLRTTTTNNNNNLKKRINLLFSPRRKAMDMTTMAPWKMATEMPRVSLSAVTRDNSSYNIIACPRQDHRGLLSPTHKKKGTE